MGQVSIAITGANGFVGRACVAEARRLGLPVIAIYRSRPIAEWAGDMGVRQVQIDLSAEDAETRLQAALPDDCALIHAAAHLGDAADALARDTLGTTQTVIKTCQNRDIGLVMVSSLAVYDTDALTPGDAMTETSPLIPLPDTAFDDPTRYIAAARDPYAGAKRLQEALLTRTGKAAWILRPGAIWGPGRSWHALIGFWASKLHVNIGSNGELPLVHVDHMAQAAVQAARTPAQGIEILNVFDDDRPDRARFVAAHKRCYGWPRLNVTVPYGLWLGMIRLLKPVSGKLPGLFREPILRARMMPLRYPNTALRKAFSGKDRDTFEGMMTHARDAE